MEPQPDMTALPIRTLVRNIDHPEWGIFYIDSIDQADDRAPSWYNIRGDRGGRVLFRSEAQRFWEAVSY